MISRLILPLLILSGWVTCCNGRKDVENNRENTRHDLETVKAAETEYPRIGGPFSHWLPLYDYKVNLADHGDTGIRGKRWGIQEDDSRTLFGESIWGLRVWRMASQADSEVTCVTLSIKCKSPDEAENAFRRLANRLFSCDPTTERKEAEPKFGEILHLSFNGKGCADYYKVTSDAEFRSANFEDIERSERELRKAEQPGAGQPATQPADKLPAKDQPLTPTSKDAPR